MSPSNANDPDCYFSWLLSRAMPWEDGTAVVLEAYFDASERAGGTFCVAGFAFGEAGAKKALHDWRRLWGDAKCHMKHLNFQPEKHYGWDSTKAGEMLKASVQIINRWAVHGVAVSCSMDEIHSLSPKAADPGSRAILGGVQSAYAMCTHAAMAALGKSVSSDVAYFFESGDTHQGESQQFMAMIAARPPLARSLYRLRSHSVLDKADCRLFEMADILAWEWAKEVDRTANGQPRRPSLAAILGGDLIGDQRLNQVAPARRAWHLTGEPLARYYRGIADFELLSDSPSAEALEKRNAMAGRVMSEIAAEQAN